MKYQVVPRTLNGLPESASNSRLSEFETRKENFPMRNPSKSLPFLLSVVGLSMGFHGMFVFAQSSQDSANVLEWRRTSLGWEQAESLPIRTDEMFVGNEFQFPTLSITTETVHQTHRLALPLAIAGLMACLGPWLLLRWPTVDLSSIGRRSDPGDVGQRFVGRP